MLLLLQTDISTRAELEARMVALTESQLAMLEQMFPRHVLEFMVNPPSGPGNPAAGDMTSLASSHENVTILFTDIIGFTTMSRQVAPAQVMQYLNELFTRFDELVDLYQIHKVETAGDCFVAAGGLMTLDEDGFTVLGSTKQVLAFAKAVLRCAATVPMPHNGLPTQVRVGMHTGPVVTGLIGTKLPKFR
ncbi:guanylate cyclase domain-containing protein [Haematococcus lacustris]|uniref:Guanylate cyclase domain-containing protein n=1 Tax=Haematococcus lacustris TaxID=44745 RepID=A0A699ZD16_HAELA|nr:guanylate cyclase domain-containing protein [Haematococcus lacustris]